MKLMILGRSYESLETDMNVHEQRLISFIGH